MNYIRCPKCQAEIEADSYFCDQCGAELFVCPKCGTYGKGKRCTRCGEPLVPAKELGAGTAAAAPVQPAGQQPVQPSAQPASQPVVPPPSPQPFASSVPSSAKPQNNSITSDIDRVLGGAQPVAPSQPAAGATVRPGSPQPAAQPAAQRQVPGHLVCQNPQLRLYIDNVIIGRREGGYVSVFASFGMVSGRHAEISRTSSGGWQVTDLGSTNGTRLNGTPLVPNVPTPFWVGDTVSFANIDFQAVP